jgi:hypothetical protein
MGNLRMKRLVILGWLLIAACGCSPAPGCSAWPGAGQCTRILFIGNSYTYVNDLPSMFAELAGAGGHGVETGIEATGSWTLSNHAASPATLDKLNSSKWNYVVLQEQSQIPASEQSRTQQMYPAARVLVRKIRAMGATPILFVTWAHRDGWPENGLQNYESMQYQIDNGYLGIAQELNLPEAPVGFAWLAARKQNPQVGLWQEDGSHPSEQGTYLAACVFYSVIFRQSPEGLSFTANLPQETAQSLQKLAAATVLTNAQEWNLP